MLTLLRGSAIDYHRAIFRGPLTTTPPQPLPHRPLPTSVTARPTAFSTILHCCDVTTSLDPLTPSFVPTLPSSDTPTWCQSTASTFPTPTAMTLSPDLHTLTANQTRPSVGTSREGLPQFNLNEETQPKVVKPSPATTVLAKTALF